MHDLVYDIPGRAIVGTDSLSRLAAEAASYGDRCVLLTESVVRESGAADRVVSQLERTGKHVIVFDELDGGSDSSQINHALGLARAGRCELVIGMGGMRVLSAARVVAAFNSQVVTVREAMALGASARPVPYIEVPSSCRNHLMFKDYCVVTGSAGREPWVVKLPPNCMSLALFDAKLSAGLSGKSYAAVLLDTILASVEGMLSTRANAFSDTLLVNAIAVLSECIHQVIAAPDDIRPRARAAEASFMSALGLATSMQGAGGAIAYTANAYFDVPKSWVGTVMLPYVLDYFDSVRPEKSRRIAQALAGGDREHDDAIERRNHAASAVSRRLLAKTGLPARLRELDLSLDDLSRVADAAADFETLGFLPVPVGGGELYDLLKQAW